jgi:hypothetical protein
MIHSSETSVRILTTRRYLLEDGNIYNYRCENHKSYNLNFYLWKFLMADSAQLQKWTQLFVWWIGNIRTVAGANWNLIHVSTASYQEIWAATRPCLTQSACPLKGGSFTRQVTEVAWRGPWESNVFPLCEPVMSNRFHVHLGSSTSEAYENPEERIEGFASRNRLAGH